MAETKLNKYRGKRDFSKTTEPAGGAVASRAAGGGNRGQVLEALRALAGRDEAATRQALLQATGGAYADHDVVCQYRHKWRVGGVKVCFMACGPLSL